MIEDYVSYCGINCVVCGQNMDHQCEGCFSRNRNHSTCQVTSCIEKMNVNNCHECQRIIFCRKRKIAIEDCFVFIPEEKFNLGMTYIASENMERIMQSFLKYAFIGYNAIHISSENLQEISDLGINNIKVLKISDIDSPNAINPKETNQILDKIETLVNAKSKNIIFLDSLHLIFKENSYKPFRNFILELVKKAPSLNSIIILGTHNLKQSEEEKIGDLILKNMMENILKSISNPQRKEILEFLRKIGKANFNEFLEGLNYKVPSKLSFHLKIMKESGIIYQNKEGVYIISEMGREVNEFMERLSIKTANRKQQVNMMQGLLSLNHANWETNYNIYITSLRKFQSPRIADQLNEINDSLVDLIGEIRGNAIIKAVLSPYVTAEIKLKSEDIRDIIAEISFRYLVDIIPLEDAVDWANNQNKIKKEKIV